MKNDRVRLIVINGIIAAIYATLTIVLAPISYGNIQSRVSEAMTLFGVISYKYIPGLAIGCLISNLVGVFLGSNILGFVDVLVGTLATIIAAYLSYNFRNIRINNIPFLSALMPVILNGVFIGAELAFVIGGEGNFLIIFLINFIEVALGEALAVFVLGIPLLLYLEKHNIFKV